MLIACRMLRCLRGARGRGIRGIATERCEGQPLHATTASLLRVSICYQETRALKNPEFLIGGCARGLSTVSALEEALRPKNEQVRALRLNRAANGVSVADKTCLYSY